MFWQRGYTATSTTDLCRALQITPPSLYAAFGSKEALYQEALDQYVATIGPSIWGPLQTEPVPRRAIEAFLFASATAFTDAPRPLGCMATLSAVGEEGNERLGQIVKAIRASGVEMIEARLREAVEAGQLPATFDTAAGARYFNGVQQGMAVQARDGASQEDLTAMARVAMAVWPLS